MTIKFAMFFSGDSTTRKRVDLGGRSSKERDRKKLVEQTKLERNRRHLLRLHTSAALKIQVSFNILSFLFILLFFQINVLLYFHFQFHRMEWNEEWDVFVLYYVCVSRNQSPCDLGGGQFLRSSLIFPFARAIFLPRF